MLMAITAIGNKKYKKIFEAVIPNNFFPLIFIRTYFVFKYGYSLTLCIINKPLMTIDVPPDF